MFGRELTCGGVPPVEQKAAASVAKVGDKGNAGGMVGQHGDLRGVYAVALETFEQTATEIVGSHRAYKAGCVA